MDDQSRIADPDPVATAVKELTSAPLRLVVDVDGEFGVFGIYDLYEEAANTLTERVEHARVADPRSGDAGGAGEDGRH